MVSRHTSMRISIHAPRTGSDKGEYYNIFWKYNISIHAPRTGSDTAVRHFCDVVEISIHAPRTGSDARS